MNKYLFNLRVLRGWMADGMTPDKDTIAALDHSMALITCVERRRICEASEERQLDSPCPLLNSPQCVKAQVDSLIEFQARP